jgi:enoyl-CoA hydratase/carnithine racemase
MSGEIVVERRGEVAVVTLANPKKRNALDPPMLAALTLALHQLPDEGVRAAVLTGEGEAAFSSGFDITALPENATPLDNPLETALDAIVNGPLPVIAALNGFAIGGGCELAATCDLRVAHAGVTLMMPPVRLGLVYSPRGLARFVSLIGESRTRELFLTAQPVTAERALVWGLVDRLVEPGGDVVATAVALASEIARGAPLAVEGTRRVLEALQPRLPSGLQAEIDDLRRRAYQSEDAREARLAFREKRPPEFRRR